MLEDLRALVEFAQAGSIAGAADRLFRTPSAITRQVQRLEAALGAELPNPDYRDGSLQIKRWGMQDFHGISRTIPGNKASG